MHRTISNALACLTFVTFITAGSLAAASVPKSEMDTRTRTVLDWRGGPVSLPVGSQHHAAEILAAAMQLPQVADLQGLFFQRGYVRRLDLDAAGGSDTLSFALLGWEKPGIPVTEASPVIQIISKVYYDPDLNTRVVATQAFAGLVRDSSGTFTTEPSGADAPLTVVELVPLGTPGAITPEPSKLPQTQDMTTPYRYAYHEGPGGIGRTIKDGWEATCPFRRGLAIGSVLFAAGAIGSGGAFSGNWWAAGLLASSTWAAEAWVSSSIKCH